MLSRPEWVELSTTQSRSSQTSTPHTQRGVAELDKGCNSTCVSWSAVQSRSTEDEARNEVSMRCGHAQDHQKTGPIWCRGAGVRSWWLGAGTVDVLDEGVRRLCTADCSTGRKLEVGRNLLHTNFYLDLVRNSKRLVQFLQDTTFKRSFSFTWLFQNCKIKF